MDDTFWIWDYSGHAVYVSDSQYIDEDVVAGHNLDSSKNDAAGGW